MDQVVRALIGRMTFLALCFTLAGCAGSPEDGLPPSPTAPPPHCDGFLFGVNSNFNGTLPPGRFLSGDYSQVQRATESFRPRNGTVEMIFVLNFTAAAGDLDFHLEQPAVATNVTLYGQADGHRGAVNDPQGGTIVVPGADVRLAPWTLIVHTGEAEPGNAHTDATFSVAVTHQLDSCKADPDVIPKAGA